VRRGGREADEVEVVLGPRVKRNPLAGCQMEPARDLLEIGTMKAAVGARQLHAAAGRGRGVGEPQGELREPRPERRPRQDAGVVLGEKSAERGHWVAEARQSRVERRAA